MEMNQKTIKIDVVTLSMNRNDPIVICEDPITSKDVATKLLQRKIGQSDREIFVVLCLDTKGYISSYHEAHVGTLSQTLIHPREIFKSAIMSNAASIIVGHNHPSGVVTPSNQDIKITKNLIQAGVLLGINVLDHLIVAEQDSLSLREQYAHLFKE